VSEPTEQEQYEHIFIYYKEQAEISPIDANMRLLVKTLNQFDGIATVACCGGHDNPGRSQKPAGEWFVTIEVYPYDKRGWDDLSVIYYALDKCEKRVSLDFAGNINGFHIDGKGIEPDDFARFVIQERAFVRRIKK